MNAPDLVTENSPRFADEELVALQLRVARRADEISRQNAADRGADLERWLQAERECLFGSAGSAVSAVGPDAERTA